MARTTFVEVAGGDFGDSDSEWVDAPCLAGDVPKLTADQCEGGSPVGTGKRARALSDPTGSGSPSTQTLRFGGTTVFRPQDGDSSDTDVEANLSAHKQQPLLCYSHIRDDCDDSCAQDAVAQNVSGKAGHGSCFDEAAIPSAKVMAMPQGQVPTLPPSSGGASVAGCGTTELERKALELQQEIQRLSSEHLRLAQENSMLLQRCQQQATTESHYMIPQMRPQMPTLSMQMPYAPSAGTADMSMMPGMPLPMCSSSLPQMVCFAPIIMQQVSTAEGYSAPMGLASSDAPLAPGTTAPLRQQTQRRQQQQSQQQQQQQQSRHAPPAGHTKPKGAKTRRELGAIDACSLEGRSAGALSKDNSKSTLTEAGAGSNVACEIDLESRTTVMLRNLPNNYTRAMLLDMINDEFVGQYDFVYMPVDFSTRASLGYAFINLLSHELAVRFWRTFEGYCSWVIPSRKRCRVSWSHPFQGLEDNVTHYRNSPVMHDVVPCEFKPVVFVDGQMQPLPPPTKGLRAPRLRNYNAATASLNMGLRA